MVKIGDVFQMFTVTSEQYGKKHRKQYCMCRCECGNEIEMIVDSIKRGRSKSCGCSRRTHDMVGTRTYSTWQSMKTRCRDTTRRNAKSYALKGIMYCEKWEKFTGFFEDMGVRPEGKTLDRINNDLGYFKENCRWATPKEQANNRTNNIKR